MEMQMEMGIAKRGDKKHLPSLPFHSILYLLHLPSTLPSLTPSFITQPWYRHRRDKHPQHTPRACPAAGHGRQLRRLGSNGLDPSGAAGVLVPRVHLKLSQACPHLSGPTPHKASPDDLCRALEQQKRT